MNKTWCEIQQSIWDSSYQISFDKLYNYVFNQAKHLSEVDKQKVWNKIKSYIGNPYMTDSLKYELLPGAYVIGIEDVKSKYFTDEEKFSIAFWEDNKIYFDLKRVLYGKDSICPDVSRYGDREPVEFNHGIIITDPCYLDHDDKEYGSYGTSNDVNMIYRDTLYGDWSCTCYQTNGKVISLGNFCADSGQVCVADLKSLKESNPNFREKYNGNHWATIIEDFEGKCWFEVRSDIYKYKDELAVDYNVIVCGAGINSKTGELITFETRQTGF